MKIEKIIAVLLILAMCLLMTACGSSITSKMKITIYCPDGKTISGTGFAANYSNGTTKIVFDSGETYCTHSSNVIIKY